MAKSLDIWYESSPSEPLPSLFQLYLWGQKWPRPLGHMFKIGLCDQGVRGGSPLLCKMGN